MQGSILVVTITMVVQDPFLIVADNPFKSMSEITIKNIIFCGNGILLFYYVLVPM